jgi:hypothetical protein
MQRSVRCASSSNYFRLLQYRGRYCRDGGEDGDGEVDGDREEDGDGDGVGQRGIRREVEAEIERYCKGMYRRIKDKYFFANVLAQRSKADRGLQREKLTS